MITKNNLIWPPLPIVSAKKKKKSIYCFICPNWKTWARILCLVNVLFRAKILLGSHVHACDM